MLQSPIALPAGSVFMDNTTLHEAAMQDVFPHFIPVGLASLSQLVESIIVHERIYILGDMLAYDNLAKHMVEGLSDVIYELPVHTEWINDLHKLTDTVLPDITERMRSTPLWPMVATLITDTDDQEPDITYIWNKLYSFSSRLRTNHGSATNTPSSPQSSWTQHKQARIARALIYYICAQSFSCPYIPNPMRAPLMLQIAQLLGASMRDPADRVLQMIDGIRARYATMITDAPGIPALQHSIPLFLGIAAQGADTVDGVLRRALELRTERPMIAFRKWNSELSTLFFEGKYESIIDLLQGLDEIKRRLEESFKSATWVPFTIGIPPSISFSARDTSTYMGRRSLWFVSDLISRSLRIREQDLDRLVPIS